MMDNLEEKNESSSSSLHNCSKTHEEKIASTSQKIGNGGKRKNKNKGTGKKNKMAKASHNPKCNFSQNVGVGYLQVLLNNVGDSLPSVLLFFNNARYLFNCGESTQRFCTETKVKLPKIRGIFLNETTTRDVSGLIGFLLTLSDIGKKDVFVYGSNINKFSEEAKYFLGKRNMEVKFTDIEKSDETKLVYNDEFIKVYSFSLSKFGRRSNKGMMSKQEYEGNGNGRKESIFQEVGANVDETSKDDMESREIKTLSFTKDHLPLVYIVKLADTPGKFNIERAKSLGLKPGPLFSDLKMGKTIKASVLDKTSKTWKEIIVKPEDVVNPSTRGPSFAIVCCPSEAFISSLINNPVWKKDMNGSSNSFSYIYHVSPMKVCTHESYEKWMNEFEEKVVHVFMNESGPKKDPFSSSYSALLKLNEVDEEFFPITNDFEKGCAVNAFNPFFEELKDISDNIISQEKKVSLNNIHNRRKMIFGEPLLKMFLVPLKMIGIDKSETFKLVDPFKLKSKLLSEDLREVAQNLFEGNIDTLKKELLKSKNDITSLKKKCPNVSGFNNNPFKELLFLGTGSAIPSKFRNVSSIYLRTKNKGVLIDCGEGTLSQFIRKYGYEGAKEIIKEIDCIWITHMHADHHLGITSILQHRLGSPNDLLILGPTRLYDTLKNFQDIIWLPSIRDEGFSVDGKNTFHATVYFVPNCNVSKFEDVMENIPQIEEKTPNAAKETAERELSFRSKENILERKSFYFSFVNDFFKSHFEIDNVFSVPVVHCFDAHGIVLESKKYDWKVVFSGDTRPSNALIEAGMNCSLLVHEATFEDVMKKEAIEKKHCTISEALDTARSMQAENVILTHFSQRYPKIAKYTEEGNSNDEMSSSRNRNLHETKKKLNVCVAFDLMTVPLEKIGALGDLLRGIQFLFPTDEEKDN